MTDSKIILFVGHWSRSHKNPDMLFYVWKEYIANIFPESILLFVGSRNLDNFEVDFDLVTEINDQVKTYFNDRVFFIEKTHHIEKYYQASDVFILPSIIEGLPNALLESMACGLPVIASRLEGVTDWVVDDGINGLLVEPGIQDDLGRAIEKVLNDSILAERLGWQARRTIEHRFSIDKVADQYAELYRRLVPSA